MKFQKPRAYSAWGCFVLVFSCLVRKKSFLFLQILMQLEGSDDFFSNLSVYVVKSRDITLMWKMKVIY